MPDEIYSIRPLIAIIFPWISLLAVAAMPRSHQSLKKTIHVLGSLATFGVVLSLLPGILDGKVFGMNIGSVAERVNIHLTVDALGYYFGLVVAFIWLLATIYSVGYIDHKENQYYSFMALCNSFILGCAFSQNMFTYFICYEIMTLAAYPLIIHEETAVARRAGLKYLVYAIAASTVIFFALVSHYFWGGGDLSIVSSGTLSLETTSRTALMLIFFCYLVGFGVKAAIVPLHGWVPDAHPAAPSPVSALLSGVILKAGAFGIIRVILGVFGLDLFRDLGIWGYIAAIASITIVLGPVFALTQDNLKKGLAYSSIGQVSYILLGLSLLSYDGSLGGIVHLAHHALVKGCLFLCAGIVRMRTGKENISEMAGVGRQLPVTMTCFTICGLAMMGTPLSVGFISKWLIASGAAQADQPFFIVVLLISSLLNAAYFLPIVYTAFFKRPKGGEHPRLQFKGEAAGSALLWPTVIMAALVIFAGIWNTIPGFPYSLASRIVEAYSFR